MEARLFFETMFEAVMDCIEVCFDSLSVVRGKNMIQVFGICTIFLVSSIVLRILELPAFITWHEALPAVVISAYLAFMDKINNSVSKRIRDELKKRGVKQ